MDNTICRYAEVDEPTSDIPYDQALEFLLLAIQDPCRPSHCGKCINGAFLVCTNVERRLKLNRIPNFTTKSRPIDPKLWNPVVAFLFLERTDEEMQSLLDCLSRCDCQMDLPDIRQYHETKQVGEFGGTMGSFRIYNWLGEPEKKKNGWNTCLNDMFDILWITLKKHSTIKAAPKGSAHTWPINLTDLIPFGPDSLVKCLLQWYKHTKDPLIFRLMACILHVCQSLIIPSLVKFKFIAVMVDSTKDLLDFALDHVFDTKDDPEYLNILCRFNFHVNDIVDYITTCCSDKDRISDDDKAALLRCYETKAVQICSLLIYISEELPAGVQWNQRIMFVTNPKPLARCGEDIFRFFHMHAPQRPSMPVHPLFQEIDTERYPPLPFPASVRFNALHILMESRSDPRCSAQGCSNTLHTAGKNFQRCGRCAVVSYCGRECQKKAWKEETLPHKRICPILKTCVEKAGGSLFFVGVRQNDKDPNSLDAVFQNWYNGPGAGLDERDLSLVVQWGTLVKTSREYTAPSEYARGFEDYDLLIDTLSKMGKCLKPVYLK